MPKIDFVLDRFPDDIYYKEADGNLYKLIFGITEELDTFMNQVETVRNSRYVDFATGIDLDKLAVLLNMVRFNTETDDQFRRRIKSKVPSFIGGGAISAIKQVVSTFLGVEPIVIEHYKPGEGHITFDNGVLNGMESVIYSGLTLQVKAGTSYISGLRITSNDTNLTLPINTTRYIKLNSDGTISYDNVNSVTATQIMLATVITNGASITNITDNRFILDPYTHYITNTATITVQIPFDFNESQISLQDTKDVLKNTKAAGVALLIKIVESYRDTMQITETIDFSFMVGHSGIGGSNFIGGIS